MSFATSGLKFSILARCPADGSDLKSARKIYAKESPSRTSTTVMELSILLTHELSGRQNVLHRASMCWVGPYAYGCHLGFISQRGCGIVSNRQFGVFDIRDGPEDRRVEYFEGRVGGKAEG
jgi:hypothetical protein